MLSCYVLLSTWDCKLVPPNRAQYINLLRTGHHYLHTYICMCHSPEIFTFHQSNDGSKQSLGKSKGYIHELRYVLSQTFRLPHSTQCREQRRKIWTTQPRNRWERSSRDFSWKMIDQNMFEHDEAHLHQRWPIYGIWYCMVQQNYCPDGEVLQWKQKQRAP